MSIQKEINKVKELERVYIGLIRFQCNSNDAIRAFHAWYKAVLILLNKYVPSENEDFQYVKGISTSGTGFILKDTYNEIVGRCAMLMDDIENGKFTIKSKNTVTPAIMKQQLVFISHASTDKPIIKEFIDRILKEGLGLRNTEIACTSFEATGVKPGHDIPQYIKDNIASAKVVLAMVSKAYKASEVCQNEVGAAWALNNPPIQVLLPDVDFDELGWLLKMNKASRIDNQEYLDSLEEVICERMGINLISPKHWNPCVKSFLEYIFNKANLDAESELSAEKRDKRANIQIICEKNRPGQRILIIKNVGDTSARKVRIDVEDTSYIDSSRPSFPVVFPEIHIGDQRSITLALTERGRELQLHISWEDDFNVANEYINTILL